MWVFLFVLSTIIGIAPLVLADSCNFNDFMTCISDKSADLSKGQQNQQWRSQAEDCIKKQGCTINMKAGDQVWQNVDDCKMKIRMSIKSDVETCVGSKYPGFKFPDSPKPVRGKENHWGQKDVTCPNNATTSVLKQCHSAIFNKSSGNDRKNQAKELRQKYCAARGDCEKKLPANCGFNDIKSTLCQCFKDKVQPKLDQIKSQTDACEASMTAQTPNNNSHAKKSKAGGRSNNEAEAMAQQFCKRNDPCDKANNTLTMQRTFDIFAFV